MLAVWTREAFSLYGEMATAADAPKFEDIHDNLKHLTGHPAKVQSSAEGHI